MASRLFFIFCILLQAAGACPTENPIAALEPYHFIKATYDSHVAPLLESLDDNPEMAIRAANMFLSFYKEDNGFTEEVANKFMKPLISICTGGAYANELRSRACLSISGIWGILSRKKKSMGDGKNAIFMVKEALRLNPKNADAALGYGTSIQTMANKNRAIRLAIETFSKMKLKDEAVSAMVALEENHLTDSQIYKDLAAFVKRR